MITKIGYAVLCVALVCIFLQVRYNNPYTMTMIFGKRGCGKTTILTKLAYDHIKRGWHVFTTEKIPGTYQVSYDMIGHVEFPENTLLLLDEAGIEYDNRNYKNFSKDLVKFWKYSRHYKVKAIFFSQTFDIDVKLRVLCDNMYMVKNMFNCVSILRKLRLKQSLIKATGMSEARIADDIVKVPFIFGGVSLVWLPRYWRYFDSFNKPLDLKTDVEFSVTDYPNGVKPIKAKRTIKTRRS